MFGELSRKYSEHINNLVKSVERVNYALFVHEPGHAGHLFFRYLIGSLHSLRCMHSHVFSFLFDASVFIAYMIFITSV